MNKLKYNTLAIILNCFMQITMAQVVDNMKGTWLPQSDSQNKTDQTSAQVDAFLQTLTGSFRSLICRYNNVVLGSSTVCTNGIVRTGEAFWSYSVNIKTVAGQPDALDLNLDFTFQEGKAQSTGVAVAFDFAGWNPVSRHVISMGSRFLCVFARGEN